MEDLDRAALAKQAVREQIWALLEREGVARFPGARGRIPNFAGAEAAAARLAGLAEWKKARVVKANPDAPQLPVRARALGEGKLVYVNRYTVLLTTVHELQVLDGDLPETDHDFRVDWIVTPDRAIHTGSRRRPSGIIWPHLSEEKIASIPVLTQLAGGKSLR